MSPRACFSRAVRKGAVRSSEPTMSARNGGFVRAVMALLPIAGGTSDEPNQQ